MERNDGEKRLRFLQRAYLVFGLSVLPLSLACAVSGIDFLWRYFYGSMFQLVLIILWLSTLFVSSILLVLSSFGIRHAKGYSKPFGVGGNVLLIVSSLLALYMALDIMLHLGYYSFTYESDLWHPMIILLMLHAFIFSIGIILVSIATTVMTFQEWKNLPAFRMSRRAKLISLLSIAIIILVGGAIMVVQEIQKQTILKGLKYVNESGWGFNPPEGWEGWGYAYSPHSGVVDFHLPDNHKKAGLVIWYGRSKGLQPIDIKKVAEDVLKSFQQNDSGVLPFTHLVSHKSRNVNGMDAYEIVYARTPNGNTTYKFKEIFVAKWNILIRITYYAEEEYYDIYEPYVEKSIESLVIV